jgi:nitrogen fixation/metabolism regulation signal transduction histidine kinase
MVSEKLLSARSRIILLLLASASFIAAGIYFRSGKIPLFILFLLTGIISFILINRIYNSTGDAISFLFDSLRNDDTTVRFQKVKGNKPLARVYNSINQLNEHFQEIKIKNEYNESYYKTVIQHASAGLLVLGADNRIELINKTACEYAGISPESTNTNLLGIKHPAFYEAVCRLKPGDTFTYKSLVSGSLQLLFFRATMIRRKDEELKLVVIQDIRNELESRETESYKKLISVLTHEIMNHLTPITSVARELQSILSGSKTSKEVPWFDDEAIRTTQTGLKLINEQSDGLISFMNSYRKISRIPQPEFSTIPVNVWIEQIRIAFSGKMIENNIEFTISADKSLKEIIADNKLLNQVMINLINNSFDAVMENESERKIDIHLTRKHENKVAISVINNGPVIPPDMFEKIFIPFFTTKKNGSGIGLSISQEIMKRHNGSLVAMSSEKDKTCFLVEF